MQQIRSSQAEMCWRNHRSSTWDCWARLDQIWLVCFFSHMPPFYSFPIFQASASLCCRTCGWVLKFDIGVVTQYGYDATNSLQPSWDVLKKQSKFHMRLLSKTGPNLACLLLLTHASFLFLSHIPSISVPVLSHLRVGVEIWHRGSDSVVLWCNKFAPAKLRCVEETIEVPHEIAEQDWTKFGLFASSHTCLPSIPFPYSKHQRPCAVALAGGCWNLTSGQWLTSAMMQQIRSSQAEMCWRNNRSSTWDCWARLDQIWLVCFFSHMPPFYSFPIFQASASLCCRTCGWVLKCDIGAVTQ